MYRGLLDSPLDQTAIVDEIRDATHGSLPLASDPFKSESRPREDEGWSMAARTAPASRGDSGDDAQLKIVL